MRGADRSAAAERTEALVAEIFRRPARLRLSQWPERHRILSAETNPEPGPWRNARVPFLVPVMDAISDPAIWKVALMCSSQSAKTEILLNTVAYYATEEPAPILVVVPTLSEARNWSTRRLGPMIRDSAILREAFAPPASRTTANTVLEKSFAGGSLTLVGANSPSSLAAKPIRVALFDEPDRYPASAGTEGDPIELGVTRTRRFWNRKVVLTASPTDEGDSPIESHYLEGDRNELFLECPHCLAFQLIRWECIRWDNGDPETAAGVCEHCGAVASDYEWHAGLARAEWRPRAERRGIASYAWNALVMPWVRWSTEVDRFLKAQGDREKLKAFINTTLAQTWKEKSAVESKALEDRAEVYPAAIPDGVAFLTAGVDLGEDRVEYVVRGWGAGEESWLIEAGWFDGSPQKPGAEVYRTLEAELRLKKWRRADGVEFGIKALGIDSGKWTDAVYHYCNPRFQYRTYATKGSSRPTDPLIPNKPPKRDKSKKCPVVILGTEQAKLAIYFRLALTEPGPGAYHWPKDETLLPANYWPTLTAEKPVKVKRNGRWLTRFELPRGKRAEALDCEVISLAMCRMLRQNDAAIRKLLERHAEAGAKMAEARAAAADGRVIVIPKAETPVWLKAKLATVRRFKGRRGGWTRPR